MTDDLVLLFSGRLLRDLEFNGVPHEHAWVIAAGGAPAWDAPPEVHSIWCRVEARRLGNQLRRELGMRELDVFEDVATQTNRIRKNLADLGQHISDALRPGVEGMVATVEKLFNALNDPIKVPLQRTGPPDGDL